jgi:hypothetical protein
MYTSSGSSGTDAFAALGSLAGGLILCWFVFIVLLVVAMIWVYYKIFEKTGNSGWLALLMFVPIANIAIILYLAFSDWPVLRELRDLRSRVGYGSGGYIPPAGTYAPPAPTYAQPTQPYAPAQPTAPMYAPPSPVAPAPQAPAPAAPTAPQAPQWTAHPEPPTPPADPPVGQ